MTENQKGVLLLMLEDESVQWWTAGDIRWRWYGPRPPGPAIGMTLRSLAVRGLLERDHGPPASYRLSADGRKAARAL